MDETIKMSIESRKNAIINTYELSASEKEEVNNLFSKIEQLGMESKDSGEFETKLAASPLNQEYIDLFTKIATSNASKEAKENMVATSAASAAESIVRNAVGAEIPTTRAAVHQKAYDAARDVPILGEALEVKQYADFFGRFKKKKDE